MRIIKTGEMDPQELSETDSEWCYNGLDTIIAREVFDAIKFNEHETIKREE